MRSARVILIALIANQLSSTAGAQEAAPLRATASILALSREEAAHEYAVRLRGVVTKPTELGVFMQDGTGGIWVNADHSPLAAGDEVEVSGVVRPGHFAPVVNAVSIHKVGEAPVPKPLSVTYQQLATGNFDSQYVSVIGEVRSAGLRPRVLPSERLWVKIQMGEQFIYAALPEGAAAAVRNLLDSVVRVDAVATETKNGNGQITAAVLSAAGIRNLTVLEPPRRDLFALPIAPIGRLMQYLAGTDYGRRVHVGGIVTYSKSGESLILQDSSGAILVLTSQSLELRPGDRVEVSGFPAPKDSGPILQDAVLRFVDHEPPPHPRPIAVADLLAGVFNNNLVSIEAHSVHRLLEPTREVLLLHTGSVSVVAELRNARNNKGLLNVPDGSTVRVSGVSVVEVEGSWNLGGLRAGNVSSWILLRSPADVQVIQPASWWNSRHLLYLAALLALLLLLVLAHVVYKYMEHWHLRAVLSERERLATELHDSLAQSFAGIGFQLQAIRDAVPADCPQLRQQVDLAWSLTRHSHKEAQRSIGPLDTDLPHESDLLAALVSSARKLVEGGSVQVTAASIGPQRTIPPHIYNPLLRIGLEAIANAVRHANSHTIGISARYEQKWLRLAIEDDGCGFVVSGSLLGFGLRGMRKRAATIGAKLEILAQPGSGTRIEVTAPLPPELTPSILWKRAWQRFAPVKSNPVKSNANP
jgi:signal transduction histidine kinase